jgi:hypothetical protein
MFLKQNLITFGKNFKAKNQKRVKTSVGRFSTKLVRTGGFGS